LRAFASARRDVFASLRDVGIKTFGHFRNEFHCLRDFRGSFDFVSSGILSAVSQIGIDCAGQHTPFAEHIRFFSRSSFCLTLAISAPSTSIRPPFTSLNLKSRFAIVFFPEPVGPIIAVVCPGFAVKEISLRASSSAPDNGRNVKKFDKSLFGFVKFRRIPGV
jgi:hypothetical protein